MELLTLMGTRRPVLLALGEPTHGEPAFPRLRDEIFQQLVGHGFRSIAVELDRVEGLAADDYVRGARDTYDDPRYRDLLTWMREHDERLTFHGFDVPVGMMSAPSPEPHLRHLRDYLGVAAGDLDRLLGDEGRWSDPAAQMDAARSIGRSPEAAALRVIADDLLTLLYAEAPRLIASTSVASWHRARVHATTALGLLRYHAVAADPSPPAERASRMLGVRDALMAENLLDIRTLEADRGPTLVFAHNRHLQRHPSRWALAGMELQWFSAGATVSALLGERYLFVAGSLGASGTLRLGTPERGTFEGELADGLVESRTDLRVREDVTAEQGYFPLDAETAEHSDAILHVATGDDPEAALARRILGLPGVAQHRIEPDSGMPEYTWGDRFFFAGQDRKRPFATIVGHDIPDFDQRSRLDRPHAYRLNIEVGRDEFRRLFGYGPEEFAAHSAGINFAVEDRIIPHPVYAVQSWASVVSPGPATALETARLLEHARKRSAARQNPIVRG